MNSSRDREEIQITSGFDRMAGMCLLALAHGESQLTDVWLLAPRT